MSFAERHKRWLLPVLAAAAAGAVWMNLPDPAPRAPEPAPAALPGAEPPPAQAPAGRSFGADLQALAAPPPSANDPAPLLEAGRQAIAAPLRHPPAPPRLHPARWAHLAPFPAAGTPPGASAPPAAAPAAPPRLDFIIDTGARREAWVQGRGYATGSELAGGYRLRRIDPDGVVVSGPRGEQRIPLGNPGTKGAPR
jgi:hypothetical protein